MGLFRDSLTETTAALLAAHQEECGKRYSETARVMEKVSDKIDSNAVLAASSAAEIAKQLVLQNAKFNNRLLGIGGTIICALAYIIYNLLHAKGIL